MHSLKYFDIEVDCRLLAQLSSNPDIIYQYMNKVFPSSYEVISIETNEAKPVILRSSIKKINNHDFNMDEEEGEAITFNPTRPLSPRVDLYKLKQLTQKVANSRRHELLWIGFSSFQINSFEAKRNF